MQGHGGPDAFTVGGHLSAEDDAAQILADHLVAAWERVVDRDEHVVERLRGVEQHYGVQVLPTDFVLEVALSCEVLLVPGARVCFTGEVVSPVHGFYGREEMQRVARERGLVISDNMTKTRTDVLVVAQRGTQSGKAKKAAQWGKPVLDAEEFLDWALP